jgi:hypothetical protein
VSDKFQVLTSVDGRTSLVIEQNGEVEAKPKWKVVVPDAGTPSTASKIARLFNKEHDEYIRVRAEREAMGVEKNG